MMVRMLGFVLAVAVLVQGAISTEARELTFEDRVKAQEAIERVYYSHQIGARRVVSKAVPRELIERKVRTYLKQSGALEQFWNIAEVSGLALAEDKVTLNWDSAAPAAGSGTTHDVLRGVIAELPVGTDVGTMCLESGLPDAEASDGVTPNAGSGFFLVRAANVCGVGSYGYESSGVERISSGCL